MRQRLPIGARRWGDGREYGQQQSEIVDSCARFRERLFLGRAQDMIGMRMPQPVTARKNMNAPPWRPLGNNQAITAIFGGAGVFLNHDHAPLVTCAVHFKRCHLQDPCDLEAGAHRPVDDGLNLQKSRGGNVSAKMRSKRCRSPPWRQAEARRWRNRRREKGRPARSPRNAVSGR